MMNIENIQNLLNKVNEICLKNEILIKARSGRFNMFSLLGVKHYELKHSKILAEFLNPKGSHDLDELFLQVFVKQFLPDFEFDCKKATVITEKYVGDYGRIDIIIEQGKKAIIIENKIYAKDQDEQLKRYENYVKNKNIEYQILYLTLNGEKANENSGKDVGYKTISYKTDIIKWLEECARISIERAIVRETIIQYIRHLKQLTEQDMDTKLKEELVKLCVDNEHNYLETALAIGGQINEIKIALLDKQLSEIEKQYSLKCKDRVFTSEQWKGIKNVEIQVNNEKIDVVIHKDNNISKENIKAILNSIDEFRDKDDRIDLKNWKYIDYDSFVNDKFLFRVFEEINKIFRK